MNNTRNRRVIFVKRADLCCRILVLALAFAPLPVGAQVFTQFGLIGIDASPSEVVGGDSFRLGIDVNHAPGFGPGLIVRLNSTNVGVAAFAPREVFVPRSQSTLTVGNLATRPVPVDTTVVLQAQAGRRVRETLLLVRAPRVASLQILTSRLAGGSSDRAVVQLTGPAPSVGLAVDLVSSDPKALPVPDRLIFPPGATRAEFPIVTNGVRTSRLVRVTASYLGSVASDSVEVMSPAPQSVTLVPSRVMGSIEVTALLQLNGRAPAGGLLVMLGSDNPAASVPAEVFVPAGEQDASFDISTRSVSDEAIATISVTIGRATESASLLLTPAVLSSIELSPPIVRGGHTVSAQVALAGPAGPDGVVVELFSTDRQIVSLPITVTLAPTQQSVDFDIETTRVFSRESVRIRGEIKGADPITSELHVLPPIKGDWDGDGDSDLSDYVALQTCFTGAGVEATKPCVIVFDTDFDGDVDLADLLGIQNDVSNAAPDRPQMRAYVDPTIRGEHPAMPGINGGPPRPVTMVTDLSGIPAFFVENELLVKTDDIAGLQSLLAAYNGEIVDVLNPAAFGLDGSPKYLVHIDPTARRLANSTANLLQALQPDVGGELRFRSNDGLALLGVAADAIGNGLAVDVNWVMEGTAIPDGTTQEAANGPGGTIASTTDTYNADAFTWWTMVGRPPPEQIGPNQTVLWPSTQHGVTDAWQYLNRSGRDAARISLAVIDGGFMGADPDVPADRVALSNIPGSPALNTQNPTGCTNATPCPWHGTRVTQAAAALIDNNLGTAGTGGQIVRPITIHSNIDIFSAEQALALARQNGARIVNMSFSGRIPATATPTVDDFNEATSNAALAGVVVFAAAGNRGRNVDAKDCFGGGACWEEAWWTPCENDGVICVGGLAHGSRNRDPASNFGNEEVDIFAPFRVFTGATPAGDPSGNTAFVSGGTSFSSPFAAGVAAMVFAADPSLHGLTVGQLLIDSGWTSEFAQVGRLVNAERAVRQALIDVPPNVEIVTPTAGASIDPFNAEFRAEASDFEDGNVTVVWTSNRDGVVGTGFLVQLGDLSIGPHTITASVTDSFGWTVSDEVSVSRFNALPIFDIIEPVAGPTTVMIDQIPVPVSDQEIVAGETVVFRGTSFDQDHFDQGGLPDGQVNWLTDLDGQLGAGHEIMAQLSEGSHLVTFRGIDIDGAQGARRIIVNVGPTPPDLPPTVTITLPSQDTSFDATNLGGIVVTLSGTANDPEDGALSGTSLVWRSNFDGILGTGNTIATTLSVPNCGVRAHQITLEATDSGGNVRSRLRVINVVRGPC